MKKSQLLREVAMEIENAEKHTCKNRDCQSNLLGCLATLRTVKLALNGTYMWSFAKALQKENKIAREQFEKMFPTGEEVEKERSKTLEEKLKNLYSDSSTTLKLNLQNYRYEGLVLIEGNIMLEAVAKVGFELIIDQSIWEQMVEVYDKSYVKGMAIVIFREYTHGVRIVDQYVNWKLERDEYFDVLEELKLKFNL
jgi:hypothetical protein